jgi:hypothetical protein
MLSEFPTAYKTTPNPTQNNKNPKNMKSRLLSLLLAFASASIARADFDPVPLTPSSYTFDIVVEANTVQGLPDCINVTAGKGLELGDNTYYEQGLYARPGQVGGNSGVPVHNTVFTSINNANMSFVMPPDYTVNNELMIDSTFTSGTLTFAAPTTATNLAVLCCGGGGALTVNYTVTHADSSTETGTMNLLDWFTGGGTVAWGANGRIQVDGVYNNFNNDVANTHAPYLYANTITVSAASPVVGITFNTPSGNHGNFFAVSGNASGAAWTPIPLDSTSFNVMGIVPAAIPFPVTATMDQGTNTANNGNLATWFETDFVRDVEGGLPPSGSLFSSQSQPTHHFQLGNYTENNAILIDTNHQVANIVPALPASYSAFALLTAGGNIGSSSQMTNLCVLQHANGVNETNIFLGYDWFDGNHPGAIALKGNGRVNLYNRTVNNVGNQFPYLFESFFLLNDTTSPVTNIMVIYKTSPSRSATTYIMAVSATSGGVAPLVDLGPVPLNQTRLPGDTATFTVGVSGTAPITGFWQVQNGGTYVPLTDGLSPNGSTITGSHTMTLTITNLALIDGTNYQFVAHNAYGDATSPTANLIVRPQTISITPATPVFYNGNDIPLKVNLSAGPAVTLQWYYIDKGAVSNNIPGATNVTYTVPQVTLDMNGYIYGVTAINSYGTNSTNVVLNITDNAAFITGDISPVSAEAYAGAIVTYAVDVRGNSPISYQWFLNGNLVSGVNSNTYTFAVPCGPTAIQVAFSNELSGGVVTTTSEAMLFGDPYPTNITFNTDGAGWQTNGTVPLIATNVLRLTDGSGGDASSAFFKTAQYVGGNWTASFTYSSHGGGADGAAFVLQTTNATAVGEPGGGLGYAGILGRSLAFEINLFDGNNQTRGVALVTDGAVGIYQSSAPVIPTTTNDIHVTLNWVDGVLSVSLTEAVTGNNFSTNYTVGPISDILGGNVAYIGFTGADGGITSRQTISDFQFHSVLPPVSLSAAPLSGNSFILSWSAADPTYLLQTSASLSSPSWVPGPASVTVNGTNQVTIDVTSGSSQQFYRLVRIVCE